MSRWRSAELLLAVLVLASACGPAGGPAEVRGAVIGGTGTSGDPAVVLLRGLSQDGLKAFGCTASIVAPHVAMTAAHCVDSRFVGPIGSFKLFFGSVFS